jgi:hypothetical protein
VTNIEEQILYKKHDFCLRNGIMPFFIKLNENTMIRIIEGLRKLHNIPESSYVPSRLYNLEIKLDNTISDSIIILATNDSHLDYKYPITFPISLENCELKSIIREKKKCTCDLVDLMSRGCKCGGE